MTIRRYVAVLGALLLALLVPTATLAVAGPGYSGPDRAATFDTPATPRPTPRAGRTPRPTQAPRKTAEPGATTAPTSLIPPARSALTVGYEAAGVVGQAPLLLALEAGYFEAVGLTDVVILEVPEDALDGLLSGDLDIAVVGATQAASANVAEPGMRAIAGYQNYQGEGDTTYGGDLLVAAPGLVANEPSTVIAFLSAYIQALQDLSDEDTASAALATIEASGLTVEPEVAAQFKELLAAYAPFDGGFGDPSIDAGLGELDAYLSADGDSPVDLDAFIAQATLNIAQDQLEILPNPDNGYIGVPTPEISIALPMLDGPANPIMAAQDAGYFEEAGFTTVEIVDVEEPLLGVLTGEVDFGVVSMIDAADGIAQGLPIAAIAGHQNYATDGSYGGDVVIATSDLITDEPAAVAAFLAAYVRALQDGAGAADAAPFAPFDGGFGARDVEAGLGELSAYVEQALGSPVDLAAMIAIGPLEFAQAALGLPANPAGLPATTVASTEEEGA